MKLKVNVEKLIMKNTWKIKRYVKEYDTNKEEINGKLIKE